MALIERGDLLKKMNGISHYLDEESDVLISLREIRNMIIQIPAIDAVPVVRCKYCKHCQLLNDKVSFECKKWDMYFYAPTYNAATFYCADGKRRGGDVQS